jgi:hypothetical protein
MRPQPDPCDYDSISLEEAREISRQLRDGVLSQDDNEQARRDEFRDAAGARRARERRQRDLGNVSDGEEHESEDGSPVRVQYRRGDCPVNTPAQFEPVLARVFGGQQDPDEGWEEHAGLIASTSGGDRNPPLILPRAYDSDED